MTIQGAFRLYDLDKDGVISRAEMLQVVEAIYQLSGGIVKLPDDEATPEDRVNKVFLSVLVQEILFSDIRFDGYCELN